MHDLILTKERKDVLRVGRQLAEYVVGLTFDDLSYEVINQAKRLILDSIGTMYMGSRKEQASGILKFLGKLGLNQECTIVGADLKTNCLWAAFANASYAQIHDANDGHSKGGAAHPGRVIIPTALAVGEKLSLSGKDLITAIVVGYDVSTRIRGKARGIIRSPPPKLYGSAAVASRMMGLDEDKVLFALGISGMAGYHSPPGNYPRNKNTDANFLSNGYASKVGIEAAMLADEGFFGLPLQDNGRASTRFVEKGLCKEFEIMNTYIKPYPTCRATHGAIEAILYIREKEDFLSSEVDEVVIHQITGSMFVAEKRVYPNSYYKNCQMDLPYCAACAILDGEVGESQFTKERIADLKVHELANKIKVIPDEDMDAISSEYCRPTLVEIKIEKGKKYTKLVDFPKGGPKNPLTDEELSQKFLKWIGSSITEKHALKIKQAVYKLDRLEKISTLTDLLSKEGYK